MIDVDLSGTEPEVPPSTRVEDPLSLNLRGPLEQLWWASPAAPLFSLAIHHFQDTTVISSPGSSFPRWGNRKFCQVCGNRAHYPHPGGNSPTNFSLGNPTQWLSWVCHSTQQPFWPTGPRTLEAGSMLYVKQLLASSEGAN